jgi:hypothetical protein
LQMVQFSATMCSCIAITWVSLVSFGTVTLCVASQRAIPKVSVCFVIDSVRKLLITPSNFIAAASRHLLGPTQLPIQLAPGINRLAHDADHFYLAPGLRMRAAIPPLHQTSSWRGA